MNSFFEQFRMFALGTWTDEGGLVSRAEARQVPTRESNAKNRVHLRAPMIMIIAASMAAGMCVGLPATAASSPWERMQSTATKVSDNDTVPLNYWAGAIAQMRARAPLNEDDYVDIDSVF